MIIGLCGLQGSGKDTLAKHLVEKYNFIKISFADSLKDILSLLFGWDRKKLEGIKPKDREWREMIDTFWSVELEIPNFTPRYAMNYIGTNLFRDQFNDEIWIKIVKKKIFILLDQNQNQNIVITDCRFMNEIVLIKELSGFIFHIYRDIPDWFLEYKNNNLTKEQLIQKNIPKSEFSWIKSHPDFILMNIFDINSLYSDFDYIFNTFLIEK